VGLRVAGAELFGVTETSATIAFSVEDDGGAVDAPARVRIGGEVRATCEGPGTRLVRIEGLDPQTSYRLEIEVDGAPGPPPDAYLPEHFETLPAPRGAQVASFATLNDLHFGEPRFGGTLLANGDYGPVAPGYPDARAGDSEVPYWQFMNEDAIADINAAGVDAAIIKGDIADRGLPEQFEAAARAFAGFAMPHHAFLGNHDYYGLEQGLEVDGYALLGQPAAPRALDLGGWRLLLLETVEPGEHHGVFGDERLGWLSQALAETRETGVPTLIFMHHQPVPPQHATSFPNDIGMRPEHSLRLFDLLGDHPQVSAVLIGHTHRNRVRRYPASGPIPFVEVHCTKDYPGGFAHYRLFDDGSFRQEVRRTSSTRALAHSTRCRDFFDGGYRRFSLGSLAARSFASG
jgi:3',5'-cyclic AMP phosphodiesterase CpdA